MRIFIFILYFVAILILLISTDISPKNIILVGDSAGGNLVSSINLNTLLEEPTFNF